MRTKLYLILTGLLTLAEVASAQALFTPQAVIPGPTKGPGSRTGQSVAVSGDTMVAGSAIGDVARVYVRSGTNWSQQAYLKAPFTANSLRFGNSVAVSGDTVAVTSLTRGRVYLFQRSGTHWTYQTELLQSPYADATTVALSDDTLVLGTPSEDSNATGVNGVPTDYANFNSGAAFVFVRQGANWSQQAYLKASNPGEGDWFGDAVAVSGDTVVVGARREASDGIAGDNDNLPGSGAAYVFVRTGTNWSQQQFLKAPTLPTSSWFGRFVALSGDRLAVSGTDPLNVVHVFRRSGNSWVSEPGLPILSPVGVASTSPWSTPLALSGGTLAVGEEFGGDLGQGQVEIFYGSAPRIQIEQPPGVRLAAGGHRDLAVLDGQLPSLTFTIRNAGDIDLTGLAITKDGPDAAMFQVTASPAASVAPGGSTTFTVRFNPTSATPKTATLRLASNDADQNPFDLSLTGYTLASTQDADGDGLNDVAEFQWSALGFDWQMSQPDLVAALLGGATKAGLYTTGQVQALNAGTPLLSQVAPGQFKLTISVEKATHLTNFTAFPLTVPQTTINDQGKLEFLFTSPDNAAFYRLELHQ